MKVRYTMGNIEFEGEMSDRKSAFEFIAQLGELFPDEPCGCCKSKNVRPSVRMHDNYKFFEIACLDCNAKLSYGQKKEGGALFIKRWDSEAKAPLPNRGWSVYRKDGKDKPSYQSQAEDKHPKDEAGSEVPF